MILAWFDFNKLHWITSDCINHDIGAKLWDTGSFRVNVSEGLGKWRVGSSEGYGFLSFLAALSVKHKYMGGSE